MCEIEPDMVREVVLENESLRAEVEGLREALKETTMLFRYMLEPKSVINLHHCDEMDKLAGKT